MKNIFLKQGLFFLLILVSGINTLQSQNVGGTNSNQSAPKEVKASELSKGAYTSDVNLFTGTMATSYDLGTVSTFAGLSYNLQLNYSTTKTVGQNPSIVRGISYGDGWNINIPTISVSVEAFQNYAIVSNVGGNCTLLDLNQARIEGDLSWFSPFISIPGVVSERFILKTIDTLRNELVFVPNIMEKYIEARLRFGSSWTVTNDNGDIYSFRTAMTNYRAAPQLNYVDTTLIKQVGVSEKNLLPKEEPMTWYCDAIYNGNSPLNQKIAFQYEVFGQFDFFKEFMQPTLNQGLGMKIGGGLGLSPFKLNRDILLVGIESYSDRGSIEKLELNYKTILPPGSAKNMLSISDLSVKRLDSLNNYKVVYSQGVDSQQDSIALHSYAYGSGLNYTSAGFNNWRRYSHVMSEAANGLKDPSLQLSNAFKNNSNPYLFNDLSSDGRYLYNTISSLSTNTELKFDHGFLESPRITHDIIPGDIYEVKSYIKNYNVADLHLQICNFDISIVSGTDGENGDGIKWVSGNDFITGSRGHNIFNTFNNPVKWTSLAHNIEGSQQPPNTYNGLIATSNFFLMPALPATFNGLNIQIGPSNSDHDFSLDMQSNTLRYLSINQTGPSYPSAYFANKFLQNDAFGGYQLECLLSPYTKPPHNFGIGLPWFMMNQVYTELSNDPQHPNQSTSGNYRFWWKDTRLGTGADVISSYPNVPTAADANVALAAFEIMRYSKNPYMLSSVKKYKYNGYAYNDSILKNKYLVNQLDLGYGFKVDTLFSYVYSKQDVTITQDTIVECIDYSIGNGTTININKLLRKDFIGYQNIYLLESVKQIPVNGSLANASSTYDLANLPTTHFYYSKMNSDSLLGKSTRYNFTGNIYLINKIVDQLGGTMKYDYYSLHDVNNTHFSDIYIDNNYSAIIPYDHYNLPSPKSFKVQIVVKAKKYFNSTIATIPIKTWLYEYNEGAPQTHCPFGAPYYGKTKTFNSSSYFIHNSYDADFGFMFTTVKYPQLNSTTIVPYDRYTHYIAENRTLTFGKLKKVEKFDAAGQILSKKEYEYKASMAFGNFLFTENKVVSSYFNDVDPEYTYSYYAPNTIPGNRGNYYDKSTMRFSGRDIHFLEIANLGLLHKSSGSVYANCFFVRVVKETNTDYDYIALKNSGNILTSNEAFRGIKLADVTNSSENAESFSGINSLKLETSLLTSSNPSLIMRTGVPLLSQTALTNITEYEYWDADSVGITESDGFEQLLNQDSTIGNSIGLNFEPSFELFRTKTYSPHLAGAYNTTENYYYYDLKQDINTLNTTGHYITPRYFDALNYSHKYRIRNLMYQKRVTSKAVNQPTIAKSEYYWYDTRTVSDTIFYNDTLFIGGIFDSCPPPWTPPSDTTGDFPGGNPVYSGCYQIPHPFELPEPGYHFTEVAPNDWWYCPDPVIIIDTTSSSEYYERSAARYLNYPSDMKTKLMLRRIDEQIDTIAPGLTYFNRYHPILRFQELYTSAYTGGPANVPLNEYGWFPGYKTKTKYRTLEHTILGQVRLDMNERGLLTRYDYQTIFSTAFIDTLLDCNNGGGAYNLTNQGVPNCITVGYGLLDSLTTCYTYNKDYTINSITDPNGMVLSYKYDNFSRMRMALRNNDTLSLNEYSQWMNDTTLSYEQRADQNYVESLILLNKGSTVAEHSRAYIDPLGRKYDVQTQVTSNYTNPTVFDTLMIHSGLTIYDNWDRVTKQYKPFKETNSGNAVVFSPQFNPTAKFTEQQYEGNQRGRVLRAAKFGENINSGHTVNSTYNIISGLQLKLELGTGASHVQQITGQSSNTLLQSQRYLKTASVDEDSKKTVSYTNAFGQKVATKTYANTTGQEVTAFIYDSQGNLKKVINPKFQNTTYEYNLSGNMFRKVSVDADTVKYLYDVSGNVVLEQDANGKHGINELDSNLYMRKYTYDIFGRLVEQDRVHYNTLFDPLWYQPFSYGYYTNITDTTKAFYQFSNTSTLDYFGGWVVEKCTSGGYVYRQTVPPNGGTGPDPFPPFDPDPVDPDEPAVNPCSMVYGSVYDSLTVAAPEKKWAYHFPVDITDTDLGTTTVNNLPTPYYLNGRLTMTKSYTHPGDFSNLNIYSYNSVGLMAKEITQFNTDTNIFTSIINYTNYNLRNSLTEQHIDADADGAIDISYQYVYDGWNRLRTLKSKQGAGIFRKLADYNYDDALGLITNTKYYNPANECNQLMDNITYKYDTRNRLTQLNTNLYSEQLFYDKNLPQTIQTAFAVNATNNYNGNINGLIHNYKLNTTDNYMVTGGIMDSSTVYGYTYDGLNRLKNADASVLNVLNLASGSLVYNAKKKYGDEAMKYDAIGNITTLDRGLYYNSSITTPANASQNWNYSYPTANNHLEHIDSVNTIPLREYTYDNNGNQNYELINNRLVTTNYMRSNLPDNVLIDHDITYSGENTNISYRYNANDDRVYKEVNLFRDSKKTYYLRDASGKELAEYDITNNTWTYYAYGRERVAEFTGTAINYYNFDHLGSSRLVYSAASNCQGDPRYTIESATDFMAFGKTLRSFNNTGKYEYQGSEKEKELSDNNYSTHFRSLDVEVNRWWQIDPKLNASITPYASMDNNPVMMTDPLGDCPSCPPGVRANGVGYGTLGFIGGLAQSVVGMAEGVYTAVRHPVQTLETVAKIVVHDPVFQYQMAAAGQKIAKEIKSTVKYGDSFDKGYLSGQVVGNVALLFVGGEAGVGTKALAGAGKEVQATTKLYRAVSEAEKIDIGINGVRTQAGTYETGKLFATSTADAAEYGKINYGFDKLPNTIMEVKVPNSVMKTAHSFEADGMKAIFVPAEQLNKLQAKPMLYSPK